MIALDDIKNLTPQERLEVFAKINSKDLELIMHHCSVELQERELVENKTAFKEHLEDSILGEQTAEERKIWL
jgi:ribonuclease HII